jgi:hypothetical protein
MKRYIIFGILLAGLCLATFLIAPVAAVLKEKIPAGPAYLKAGPINESLKEDLLTIHADYRMKNFALQLEQGQQISSALHNYGYETGDLESSLTDIECMGTNLSDALDSQNRSALKQVDKDIRSTWKNFFASLRSTIHGDPGIPTPE